MDCVRVEAVLLVFGLVESERVVLGDGKGVAGNETDCCVLSLKCRIVLQHEDLWPVLRDFGQHLLLTLPILLQNLLPPLLVLLNGLSVT